MDVTKTLQYSAEQCLRYLAGLETAPVDATVSAETLRARLDLPLPAQGVDPVRVIEELVEAVDGGLTQSAGGRFFGWVIGGSLPAALGADWLTSTWDQVPGVYAVSPAGSLIEEVCGRWLLELLHLPESASFAFVTGCQMAHVTCLAAARNALLAKCNWDVEENGLYGAPPIRVLASDQRHGTLERAFRMLGMGRTHVIDMPADSNGLVNPGVLDDFLSRDSGKPSIVLLQAGNVNTGAFDNFVDLIPIAHKYNAWVHVDGAFGMWAAASPKYQHLIKGIEGADSWATDGHKWLNVPYDCGYAFVADPEAHKRVFAHEASYLHQSESNRDAIDWSAEHSRRARGFATYAAIRSLGLEGVAGLVERCCLHADAIVRGAGEIPGVQVVCEPLINQGLLRFLDPSPNATEADHDAQTKRVLAAINASGEALFTATTWHGQYCMRVSVSNWATSDNDVRRALDAIASAVKTCR